MGGKAARGAAASFVATALAANEPHRCMVWPFGKTRGGYGMVRIGRRLAYAHRLVLEKLVGQPPSPTHEAAHSCGNNACVNPSHLRWATHTENMADRVAHGTDNRGEKCGTAKLCADDVRAIRRLRGVVNRDALASRYGINPGTVSVIQLRGTWRHL